VAIDSRPGITLGLVATQPVGPPKAAAILFTGGHGKLKLWKGRGPRSKNFLVRSRQLFAERGLLTVTMDVPSDRRSDRLVGFRDTEEHRTDVAAVVKWLRSRTKAPIWLIGTSRGTVSLSHVASQLPIDGVVFTASVTEISNRRPATALDGKLEDITVPALLVHHRADDCVVTPAYGVSAIAKRLKQSPKVETKLFSGGTPSSERACGAISPHGFLGIEGKVVGTIVDWMLTNAPR
jgi:dienelactone hydrolase